MRRVHSPSLLLAAGLLLGFSLEQTCRGGEEADRPAQTPPASVVADVPLLSGYDDALVVVGCLSEQRTFAFDTGATLTVLDETLRPLLGNSTTTGKVQGTQQVSELTLYHGPAMQLAGARLRSRYATCLDLTPFGEMIGRPISGMLGVDAVETYVVEVDLVGRRLRLLSEVPAEAVEKSERFGIVRKSGGWHVRARIADGEPVELLLDTGFSGVLGLDRRSFDRLHQKDAIEDCREITVRSMSGKSTICEGRLRRLALGRFEHSAVPVSRNAAGLLGYKYLQRYVVVFDFPRKQLYLRASPDFDMLQPSNDQSGLQLIRRRNETLVHDCLPQSPASEAGFRKDDRLIEMEGTAVDELALHVVRDRLTRAGETVEITAARGEETFTRKLTLREYRKLVPPPKKD